MIYSMNIIQITGYMYSFSENNGQNSFICTKGKNGKCTIEYNGITVGQIKNTLVGSSSVLKCFFVLFCNFD